MKEKEIAESIIEKELKQIEKDKQITILFAVEAGSRVWGMESADSDYDVRFVYKRPMKEYLKLNKPTDVVDRTIENRDYLGFDIYKFCGLLNSSNPSAIEWLESNIHYVNAPPESLRCCSRESFNPLALYHHYRSMGKQNYLTYIKSGDQKTTYKKYLYAMRGIFNSEYVRAYGRIPPINFPFALGLGSKLLPEMILSRILEIIKKKKEGKEKEIVRNIVRIDLYIEYILKENNPPLSVKKVTLMDDLNDYILKEVKE